MGGFPTFDLNRRKEWGINMNASKNIVEVTPFDYKMCSTIGTSANFWGCPDEKVLKLLVNVYEYFYHLPFRCESTIMIGVLLQS